MFRKISIPKRKTRQKKICIFFPKWKTSNMNGKEFGEWLDLHGIDVAEAAAYFGVSEGSIYKWRSTPGVPDRKLEWVRTQMDAYGRKATQAPQLDRVVLEITDEQFAAWNDAAMAAKLRLKDWCITTLEAAAEEQTGSGLASDPLAQAREPGVGYARLGIPAGED